MSEQRQNGAVTIFDVAAKAGVSYSTVSRVANGYQFVKPATRRKVEAAMKELGYVANLKARSLAGGRSQMIGLLVYDFQSSYLVEIVRGIDSEMADLDYDMMLSTTHHRKRKESMHVKKLTQGMVDGLLIVLPTNLEGYVDDLTRQNVPYVLIDYTGSQWPNANTVQATNHKGMYEATTYLIQLGHRRIGFITGMMQVGSSVERLAGFRQAMDDHQLPINPNWLIGGDFMEPSGYLGAKQLLQQSPRPTAIVCSNDVMAFGAIRAIHEVGLRVPHDISVLGFDDLPESSYFRPKLTTVRQPLQEMGRVATRILVQSIEKPGASSSQIELPTELIARESSAPPPA